MRQALSRPLLPGASIVLLGPDVAPGLRMMAPARVAPRDTRAGATAFVGDSVGARLPRYSSAR